MKQVAVTDSIRQKLQSAGADPAAVAVFEATALNTLPVRKNHPLYKGATHSLSFLHQMSEALSKETLPLQIMHDGGELPAGRVFYSEVLNNELRVLFWVDSTQADLIKQVDNGTIDQVSVSVLPKSAACSVCGFDFFGPDATFDNIWSGTCPNGHTMGEDGAHLLMDQLDRWFELSLVGQGGISGARISTQSEARLVADGSAASMLTLMLSSADLTEKPNMELKELVENLAETRAQIIVLTNEKSVVVSERDAAIAARDTAVQSLSAFETEVAALKAEVAKLSANNGAADAIKDIAQHVLTISGRVSDTVPETLADIVTLVKSVKLSLPSPSSRAADHPSEDIVKLSAAAFKRAR